MKIRNLFAVMSIVLMSAFVFVGCKNKECKEKCSCEQECCKEKCCGGEQCGEDCCKKACSNDKGEDACCHKDSTKTDVTDTSKQNLGTSTNTSKSSDPFSTANYFCPMKCEGGYSDAPGKCPTCGLDLKQRQG